MVLGMVLHSAAMVYFEAETGQGLVIKVAEAYRVSTQHRVSFSRKISSRVWVKNASMPPSPLILIG